MYLLLTLMLMGAQVTFCNPPIHDAFRGQGPLAKKLKNKTKTNVSIVQEIVPPQKKIPNPSIISPLHYSIFYIFQKRFGSIFYSWCDSCWWLSVCFSNTVTVTSCSCRASTYPSMLLLDKILCLSCPAAGKWVAWRAGGEAGSSLHLRRPCVGSFELVLRGAFSPHRWAPRRH